MTNKSCMGSRGDSEKVKVSQRCVIRQTTTLHLINNDRVHKNDYQCVVFGKLTKIPGINTTANAIRFINLTNNKLLR